MTRTVHFPPSPSSVHLQALLSMIRLDYTRGLVRTCARGMVVCLAGQE